MKVYTEFEWNNNLINEWMNECILTHELMNFGKWMNTEKCKDKQ